MYLQCWMKEI